MSAEIVAITDAATGAEARILVSLGFNCFSWRPVLADGQREMLWAHPDFAGGGERPAGSGLPLLFPFPGRIGGAKFSFGGREYLLEPGDQFGNAIHGFVLSRPWRVVEHRDDCVVGEFQASRDDPSILVRWPSDFRIRVSYAIRGPALEIDTEYENTGGGSLPCGFGTHAYFRLPLVAGGEVEQTMVTVPATKVWEAVDMLPTGRLLAVERGTNLSNGGPLAGRQFDTCFTGLAAGLNGLVRTELADRASGHTVTQTFDAAFTQCVVYTPPHREAICLEPYTCVPDPFRLAAEGHVTGLQILQPGERLSAKIQIARKG